MAMTVRTICEHCGTIEVPIHSAHLALGVDSVSASNELLFRCSICELDGRQIVTERGTRLLSDAGITVVVSKSPSPIETEPRSR